MSISRIFVILCVFFFFKQKTAYEMRISDWSSDVCSSDLPARRLALAQTDDQLLTQLTHWQGIDRVVDRLATDVGISQVGYVHAAQLAGNLLGRQTLTQHMGHQFEALATRQQFSHRRSEEHTSELQSLMRISYAVFCLK